MSSDLILFQPGMSIEIFQINIKKFHKEVIGIVQNNTTGYQDDKDWITQQAQPEYHKERMEWHITWENINNEMKFREAILILPKDTSYKKPTKFHIDIVVNTDKIQSPLSLLVYPEYGIAINIRQDEMLPKYGYPLLQLELEKHLINNGIFYRPDVPQHYVHGVKGGRTKMEDAHYVSIKDPEMKMYAVFDGHGGAMVSDWLSKHMDILKPSLQIYKKDKNLNVFDDNVRRIFKEMQTDILKIGTSSGSTFIMAVLYPKLNRILFINLGDSRAIVIENEQKVVFTTVDQGCGDKNEIEEYKKIHKNKHITEKRLRLPDFEKVTGISVCRSFGDPPYYKLIGDHWITPVISNFDINSDNDYTIVIACDGLYEPDSITNDAVMDELKNKTKNPAEQLTTFALNQKSEDNVSVIVVYIKK